MLEKVHTQDLDVPESIISGLAELGCFGLSIPEAYGGTATGTALDNYGMVIATEELSRASLSIGGSLITRPEILARAIENGGTEEQKQRLLPLIASGQCMSAVAVTEPDFGSDVAGITTLPDNCQMETGNSTVLRLGAPTVGRADLLMVLARTNPDISVGHRGLSIFVVEKERVTGHSFSFQQNHGGKLEGRAIPTDIGECIAMKYLFKIGESLQIPLSEVMPEKEKVSIFKWLILEWKTSNSSRAVGVMQRAYEEALLYSKNEKDFGSPSRLPINAVQTWSDVFINSMCRQYTYKVGELMSNGGGTLEAAMVKAYACKAAEWVTRESMQIHGGFGYAEEYVVSRLYVDASVIYL